VSPTDTTKLPASKPLWDFRYVYTRWPKISASESVPANSSLVDVLLLSHQHLPLILMFLLSSEKVNVHVLIILFSISFFMIVPILLFASLPCLYLLSLFLGLMRRQYWYQHESRPWIRWMHWILKELGIWSLLPKE